MTNRIQNSIIAVTGGCGFIGSHLIDRLLKLKVKKIIVIDSLEYGNLDNIQKDSRVHFFKHKLGFDNPNELLKALDSVEYLFHLAAEKHNQSKDAPEKVQQSNILGTYNLYNAAAVCGVKKIVFSSSLYAYGRTNLPKYNEKEIVKPNTIYGMSKVAGENLLYYFNKQNSIKFNILRYLFVYGPRQYSGSGYKSVIFSNFKKILNNTRPTICGDGEQTYDYIYIDDVIDATIKSMTSEISGEIFNIATSKPISINKLTKLMLEVANSDLKPEYIKNDWTHGTYRVGDSSKALNILDFKAKTDILNGLRVTYDWIKNN